MKNIKNYFIKYVPIWDQFVDDSIYWVLCCCSILFKVLDSKNVLFFCYCSSQIIKNKKQKNNKI